MLDGATAPVELSRLRSLSDLPRGTTFLDLFIPAPGSATREEAFDFHITTRNFFAYVLGQPLVGRHMGQTFVALYERMNLFRIHTNNHEDFLAYAENQGYRDLVECTDYALASLYYAERYKLRDVWIDAFTHCVGMGESVALSPEYVVCILRCLVFLLWLTQHSSDSFSSNQGTHHTSMSGSGHPARGCHQSY